MVILFFFSLYSLFAANANMKPFCASPLTLSSRSGLAMLVFFYGGTLVFSGEMTPGQLTSFLMFSNNLQRALAKLSILFGHLSKASGIA